MNTLAEYLNAPMMSNLGSENLISSDGVPVETPWHRAQMNLLIDSLYCHWHGRKDFFAGGDMFLYFSNRQVFNKDFRGPDFFVVKGVDGSRHRVCWAAWEENGRVPDLIVELLSPSTVEIDRVVKRELYDTVFRTPEYFLFDPESNTLESFQKTHGRYEEMSLEPNGMIWSRELELYFGRWYGNYLEVDDRYWLSLFDVHGNLIPTNGEAAEARAVAESQRADTESKRAKAEARKAKAESKRADAEAKARVEAENLAAQSQAEIARLLEELKRFKSNGTSAK